MVSDRFLWVSFVWAYWYNSIFGPSRVGMDNHLHLIVHVPPVPKEYWLDANEEPAAYAFGMRPPECRVPLWNGDSPSLGSLRIGDSPSPGSVASSAAVVPKETRTSGDGDSPRRPPVGFMLDVAEMLARLRYLYGGKRVDDIAEEWARRRRNGPRQPR